MDNGAIWNSVSRGVQRPLEIIWDWVRLGFSEIGDLKREVDISAFLEAYNSGRQYDYLNNKHIPALHRCHHVLLTDDGLNQEFPGAITRDVHNLTKALHEVIDMWPKPVKMRETDDDQRRYVATLGNAWRDYLFDGNTRLSEINEVRIIVLYQVENYIDTLRRLHSKVYKVEFSEDPFGTKFEKDISLELDSREILSLWGYKDCFGNPITRRPYGRVMYRMKRL